MAYGNLERPRGMLRSIHAHRAGYRSTRGCRQSPRAITFKPRVERNQRVVPSAVDSTALVSSEPQDDDREVTVLASHLHYLNNFYNEEILSLRQDIEMLKQGGWMVTVGSFEPPEQPDLSKVEATRQRFQRSSDLVELLSRSKGTSSKPRAHPETNSDSSEPSSSPGSTVLTMCTVHGAAEQDASQGAKKNTDRVTSPPPHLDTPIPSIEDPSFVHMSAIGNWQPRAIRNLSALDAGIAASIPATSLMQTFSWEFIRHFLAGKWWGPGFYYHAVAEGRSILPSRTYYLLDASIDPYVPRVPGAHGAKLAALFNPDNPEDVDGDEAAGAYLAVPVFVARSDWPKRHQAPGEPGSEAQSAEYVYMGMYSQLRFSDKLDYDRQTEHVPDAVKMYWAEQLADMARPVWVTNVLMKIFVQKPEYEGPLPGYGNDDDIRREIGDYMRSLKEWEHEAKREVDKLTVGKVLQAFDREDAADPPGLRFWWEYLQCVGWDCDFYEVMVREQARWAANENRIKSMA